MLKTRTVVSTGPVCTIWCSGCRRLRAQPSPYGASYTFNWLSASGTACLFAVMLSAIVLRVSPAKLCALDVDDGQATRSCRC